MGSFEIQIESTTNKSLRASFIKVKERIQLYWDRLFADPFVVDVNGEKKMFFIHRTNNIMEQQFRAFAYSYRRIHGNRSIPRNLENIPEALSLVANLKNPNYVRLVFEDESKIAKRFSKIDIQKIRLMADNHYNSKKKKDSQKCKKILRNPELRKQLTDAFAYVAN